MKLFQHHQETIALITKKFERQDNILALIVGGSIAHGFAKPHSDVDIILVVSDAEYARRLQTGNLTYWENESCAYEGGYVDGKYICPSFMEQVARRGSEPARFAFQDAWVVYTRLDNLDELIRNIVRYPAAQKDAKIKKFYAQFEAWKWFCSEALRQHNLYLLNYAVSNFILFGGRLILAYNETLYPYHKWFLKVLEQVERQPVGMMNQIERLLQEKTTACIEEFYQNITRFADWGCKPSEWPNQFMTDTELSWMHDHTPPAEL